MPHKKALFIATAPVVPIDGATISMLERFFLLRRDHGWETEVLCTARKEHSEGLLSVLRNLGFAPQIEGQYLRYTALDSKISMRLGMGLDRFNPQNAQEIFQVLEQEVPKTNSTVVMGNLRDTISLSYLAQLSQGCAVIFLTEDEYPRPGEITTDLNVLPNQSTYRNITHLFVASEFLRASYRSSWGVDAQVFTNSVITDRFHLAENRAGEFITMLHPMSHKGISLFLDIAKNMPERKFLVVGGIGTDYREQRKAFSAYPNVEHRPFTNDIESVYHASRVVLVPSLWKEAFSRVVVEALACGIPVIASDCGGIREAGEEAAEYLSVNEIVRGKPVPAQDSDPWIKAIKRLDDPAHYAAARAKAIARTRRFVATLRESMKRLDYALLSTSADGI